MIRDLLANFPIVAAVAKRGGFAAAAAHLGMSPSAVSHAVKTVEDGIGMPLFLRTTRSVALTDAGAAFMARIAPALGAIEETVDEIRAAKGRVTGVLRLTVPRVALSIAMTPILSELAWRYPDLTVEITSDDGLVDLISSGFDAGIRLGEMIAEDMVAIRLTPPFKAIMVAAPSYLASKGVPKDITGLATHNCIGFRLVSTGGAYAWELAENGSNVAVQISGTVRVTDPSYAKDLALAGIGIAYIFEPLVRAEIREKKLRWIIPEASIEEPGLFLYFPRRASEMPKLRAFIDVVRALFNTGSATIPS
jgi:DNA-binding transcriptional LysR family regulator